MESGTEAGAYAYDFAGHRVWRQTFGTGSPQTAFVYDPLGRPNNEANAVTGAAQVDYVWLDGAPIGLITGSGASAATYALTTGQIDEPQLMTSATQAPVWNGYLKPFGQYATFATPTTAINLRYPGQWYQAEGSQGGLHQNGQREYEPYFGRYTQPDPLGIDAGPNPYAYVDGDPLNESDPEGMWPLGAPKGGFKFGNIQVPSEQSVINQLQAALLKAGTCKNSGQAHQIAVDIANKIGWGDLNLAQSLYKSIQNNKPLTKPQQNAAQNFVNGLPAPDQGPLQQLLSKQ